MIKQKKFLVFLFFTFFVVVAITYSLFHIVNNSSLAHCLLGRISNDSQKFLEQKISDIPGSVRKKVLKYAKYNYLGTPDGISFASFKDAHKDPELGFIKTKTRIRANGHTLERRPAGGTFVFDTGSRKKTVVFYDGRKVGEYVAACEFYEPLDMMYLSDDGLHYALILRTRHGYYVVVDGDESKSYAVVSQVSFLKDKAVFKAVSLDGSSELEVSYALTNKTGATLKGDSLRQQLLELAFFFAKESREDTSDGQWNTSYDVYEINPNTNENATLVGKTGTLTRQIINRLWLSNGELYTYSPNNPYVIYRLTKNGLEEFVRPEFGRIESIFLGDLRQRGVDTWFLLVETQTGDHWILEYNEHGTLINSERLTQEVFKHSPDYEVPQIVATSNGWIYINIYGGDAGAIWGRSYRLINGFSVENLWDVQEFKIEEVSPDGTKVLGVDKDGYPEIRLATKVINSKPAQDWDVLMRFNKRSIHGTYFIDDDNIIWADANNLYLGNINSGKTEILFTETSNPFTFFLSPNRKFAFIVQSQKGKSSYESKKLIIIDIKNKTKVREIALPKGYSRKLENGDYQSQRIVPLRIDSVWR